MEAAIGDLTLNPESFDGLVKGLGELGIRSFELTISKDLTTIWGESLEGEKEQKEFLKKIKDSKLKICAGRISTHLSNEDIKPEIDYAVKASQVAANIGVKVLRIDAMANDKKDRTWQEYLERAVSGITECIEQTKNLEVDFAVENHGFISNRVEFLRELYGTVDSPRLGHNMDTGNFYWFGYPLSMVYDIIEEFAPLTKHTHVKSIKYPEETREKTREMGWGYDKFASPLDEGDIDIGKVVMILKKFGFENDLCIENECFSRFEQGEKMSILQRDVDLLKSLLGQSEGLA